MGSSKSSMKPKFIIDDFVKEPKVLISARIKRSTYIKLREKEINVAVLIDKVVEEL